MLSAEHKSLIRKEYARPLQNQSQTERRTLLLESYIVTFPAAQEPFQGCGRINQRCSKHTQKTLINPILP